MQMRPFNLSLALTATLTTNLLNPATATGGVNGGSFAQVIYISRMRAINTGVARTVTLYKGLTGANTGGTEFAWNGTAVGANGVLDVYFPKPVKFSSALFLVGGASGTGVTLEIEGEIGVDA